MPTSKNAHRISAALPATPNLGNPATSGFSRSVIFRKLQHLSLEILVSRVKAQNPWGWDCSCFNWNIDGL